MKGEIRFNSVTIILRIKKTICSQMVLLLQQFKLQTLTFLSMTLFTLNAFLTGIQIQTILGNLIIQKLEVTPSTTSLLVRPSYILPFQTSATVGVTSVWHQTTSMENCLTDHQMLP